MRGCAEPQLEAEKVLVRDLPKEREEGRKSSFYPHTASEYTLYQEQWRVYLLRGMWGRWLRERTTSSHCRRKSLKLP
jgi:hypothetical protein